MENVTEYRNSIFIYDRNEDPLVFNKYNKTDAFRYQTWLTNPLHHITYCRYKDPTYCQFPPFAQQMDASLFEKIDGVIKTIESSDDKNFGYLLLLNIDGRPKICFTSLSGDISEQVRHKYI